MKTELRGGRIFKAASFAENDLLIVDNDINSRGVITLDNSFILPSFCDVHVHLREPGQEYKETISTGSMAAAHGGFTSICAMPNLSPAPSDIGSLEKELEAISGGAAVNVLPYGTITSKRDGRSSLSDMEGMAPYVCGFSDDGTGVQDGGLMREAMFTAREVGKLIAAHCEDESLLAEGKLRESEWRQIERDIKLADDTGCGYHVCHISCRESVELIRDAKKSGVDISCETAPHYLLLDTAAVEQGISSDAAYGGRFKVNPPVRDRADRLALVAGALDGTIDMIATDHAPHSAEEKLRGFAGSLNGIVGLETAFPVLYTELVRKEYMTLARLVEMMSHAPRRRFGIAERGYVVLNLTDEYRVDSGSFLSMGRSTPFEGMKVFGRTVITVSDGRVVYMEDINE